MAKVRVYELAKELGVESKTLLTYLKDKGEFVRSASSTIEPPVVRTIKESFPAELRGAANGHGNGSGASASAKTAAAPSTPAPAPARAETPAPTPAPAAAAPPPAPAPVQAPAAAAPVAAPAPVLPAPAPAHRHIGGLHGQGAGHPVRLARAQREDQVAGLEVRAADHVEHRHPDSERPAGVDPQ